jgi:stearoyl-CoA desaturase (delta-9 desaturase)
MQTQPKVSRIAGVVVLDRRRLAAHRWGLVAVSVIPLAGLAVAVWTLWGRGLSATDAAIFGGFYAFAGLGVTVGFHRLLAHKTFEAPAPVRAVLAVAGSFSIEMSAIDWAATHRRHHAYSDKPGDPHSPHLDAAQGWRGIVRGLWYAHMGWLFSPERSSAERWVPDLLKDPVIAKVSAQFGMWVAASFVAPALVGLAVTRSITGMLTAFLWGSLVRILLLHHVTFSINSICHYFGRRPFDTKERSTNVWPLALLSFGESWHNNHHAFPSSAILGHRAWQLDPGTWLINVLSALRLARKVRRPTRDEVLAARRLAA